MRNFTVVGPRHDKENSFFIIAVSLGYTMALFC